jgi:acetyl-CoA acetyltransferase family protein
MDALYPIISLGETAENIAHEMGITREEQDAFALESQRRAAAAQAAGRFADEITPVLVQGKDGGRPFEVDEHVRGNVTLDSLAALKPSFREGGSVTAGNSSGINDAAAAVVVASGSAVAKYGLAPLGRLAGFAAAGVAPRIMGIGPVPATRRLLDRLGLSLSSVDVVELNEAFAAQALAVIRELELDGERVNPNGGAIALGHPLGATGAILLVKALGELRRRGEGRALATACIGGGQGIAGILEVR